jgi:glycerol-3-phosphate dehydrogenase
LNRESSLNALRSAAQPFDVVIVGGGATGLGAAVDAAVRGYRVALIEQSDFAKGTSSRSTKLVHGGVRYLRQGNVSLVLEALRERGRLARNAPHLVHDLAFVIPSYRWWEGPFYGIGMKWYDRLAGKLSLGPSRLLNRDQTLEQIPNLEPAALRGGVLYHDGQFDDSRLAINLAETASELGAALVNYCRCTALLKQGTRICGVRACDSETGESFEIPAKAVINATGVFVDELRRQDEPRASAMVAVSQGIHLVLPKRFLPGSAALMIPRTADGRVLFAVPWHGKVVVGTTDTPRPVHSLEPRALDEERNFVLEHARKYLATDPTEADVLSIFAGLRPLVKAGGAGSTAALSRDHTIAISSSGLITITGGKWTTYRKMAEDVVNQAEKVAGLKPKPAGTEDLPIHGATRETGGPEHLRPYGSDAPAVNVVLNGRANWTDRLHPALPYQKGEVIWQARMEMARTIEDVLARRTRALLLNAVAAIEAAPEVARLLATELGRDERWQNQQVEAFRLLARGYVFADPASRAR